MKGFITMIRDISDVAYDASAATIINAAAIASIGEKTWGEATIGTIKLLEPSANDISGLLFGNTIIQGTDLSGLTIGDNNQALNEYSIALGQGAVASGTAGFVYRDRDNNTFVFDSGGSTGAGNLLINGTNPEGGGGTLPQDIPNNLDVSGTIEASGVILAPIHSAEGSSQSAITELDPSKNPLMTKGMYWINKAQDKSDGWSYVAPMDISRNTLGAAALGGKIYAVGGWNVTDAVLNSVEVYDPIVNSWNPIAPMDISRNGLGVAALGGKLYAWGGQGAGFAYLKSAEVYDPIDNSWNSIAPMDVSCAHFGAVALGGKLYAVGGTNEKLVEVYDPSLVQMPQITYRGEDFYISHARGGPKTFVIPHPEHEGKMLRHACLEAPTRGTNVYEYQITTTEDNQTTEIALPSYFKHINGRARVYVSASEQNGWGDCRGAVNDELTTAIIETEKSGIYNVMITGVRKDPEAVAYSATENIDEPIDAKDI